MTRFALFFTIISFSAIAVFGFLTMGHSGGDHTDCLASRGNAIPCPIGDPLGFAEFHLNAFRGFSNVTFGDSAAFFLKAFFAMMAALAVFTLGGGIGALPSLAPPFHAFLAFSRADNAVPARKFTHWLSLFETSPTSF